MNTWVALVTDAGAKILVKSENREDFRLYREIALRPTRRCGRKTKRNSMAQYVAEEMSIACGSGTGNALVLLAPPKLMNTMKTMLVDQVGSLKSVALDPSQILVFSQAMVRNFEEMVLQLTRAQLATI